MFPIMTLNGMRLANKHLFDAVQFPDIDNEVLVDTIMMNYGDREVIYPDADTMQHAIEIWFRRVRGNVARLWRVNVIEYNPIWNKDGKITETRTPDLKRQNDTTGDAQSDTSGEAQTLNDRQGFDSDDYAPVTRDKSTDKGETSSHTSGTSIETETGTETIERLEQGNIGVTKTQEMILDEWNLWTVTNFYNSVATMFARDFIVALF